ncbi:hypothetical protein [Nannocystis punicea]|uniref:Uncharacterized protein n=1 Tax=Nannocystis punicea TaxID=2995304 RepID=A0ABY7HBD6_9BACT|nr:hypothetical protein [Nannocystis poenicansa]WAS96400.1 hypothetical protein O0S08_09595 [Nannocystis poenicansa]
MREGVVVLVMFVANVHAGVLRRLVGVLDHVMLDNRRVDRQQRDAGGRRSAV